MAKKQTSLTVEQKQQLLRMVGLAAGIFSKAILEATGCEVDYKINGENISDIEKLHGLDITERIKLAVSEERYEDAARLKRLLEIKNNRNK
jgi:hypothetical protein